ncbi:hypothetical protein VCR26J2_450099 [Vibrio coralliirubri]|nr:hypothetical protein VCR1J2_430033 [Vibrio coralliirubri]CDT35951.1 hypothetical protein VCR6J2_390033 [Vibrio coralliirubri]CDT87685.1 hypothetical protein VCR26J2_450099 [Vibrio coralliirubri]CDT93734.1 hypothetical protein VCR8J2_490033 [Vibrio coralliirubri]
MVLARPRGYLGIRLNDKKGLNHETYYLDSNFNGAFRVECPECICKHQPVD